MSEPEIDNDPVDRVVELLRTCPRWAHLYQATSVDGVAVYLPTHEDDKRRFLDRLIEVSHFSTDTVRAAIPVLSAQDDQSFDYAYMLRNLFPLIHLMFKAEDLPIDEERKHEALPPWFAPGDNPAWPIIIKDGVPIDVARMNAYLGPEPNYLRAVDYLEREVGRRYPVSE